MNQADDLARRVASLEKANGELRTQLRQARRVTLVGGLLLGVGVLAAVGLAANRPAPHSPVSVPAQSPQVGLDPNPVHETISAERFMLRDRTGGVRAEMSTE